MLSSLILAPYHLFVTPQWQRKARAKVAERERLLSEGVRLAGVDVDVGKDVEFLKAGVKEITERIAQGEWTAVRVVQAYVRSSARAHKATNCLTEILYAQALAEAQKLDEEFGRTGKLKGPLHGVPVSLKDQLNVEGVDTTLGFTKYIGRRATEDAALAQIIRAAGGIPIVKTNIPQTMLSFECANPLFGCTTNPRSPAHTSGGSSGGEAALLAQDGSVFGIGSDVGGSLRIPTSFCGVYSLKPGHGRWPTRGAIEPVPGYEGVHSVLGPMARSVSDLQAVARAILESPLHGKASESTIVPLPWRDIELPKRVRFGYYKTDGFVTASPACQRAVQETVDALRREGHEMVEIELPDVSRAFEIFVALSSSDGYKTLLSHVGPDPRDPSLFLVALAPRLPKIFRDILVWSIRTFTRNKAFARILAAICPKSVGELWRWTKKRSDFIEEFRTKTFKRHNLDAIIAPVNACPGLPHGATKNLNMLATGTILYNIVDSAVGVLPVTNVDPNLDALPSDFLAKSRGMVPAAEALIYGGRNPVYDVHAMKGLSVGVQVVGRGPFEEERVLAMLKVVDDALGPRGFGVGTWTEQKPTMG